MLVIISPEMLKYKKLCFVAATASMERKHDSENLINPGTNLVSGGFVLSRKDKIEISLISERLARLGYSSVGQGVPAQSGEFSFRGGVLDLWLERYKKPVRVDLFGETIEKIYLFEPSNSVKIKDLSEVYVVPFKSTPLKELKWGTSSKDQPNKYERLFLSEVQPGDYVVHIDHGLGRFLGLQSKEVAGIGRTDNLVLEYAKGDRLFVPVNQIERVTRFIGSPGHRPSLNYLGTGAWEKTKERVKKSVVNIARELLQLYAVRETIQRQPYIVNTPWQRQLAESFPYHLTEDQIISYTDITEDLSTKNPMDRLLVGDVGFGKTEVALRTAFVAVESGKQVALLCPTTLLTEQHYHLFKERLKDFPIVVEYLSRFSPNSETKQKLADLKEGKIDVIIGTHRILSKDIEFKRLGLLVIDEEHKFGVRQKELLKNKRLEVDVLSLSATPIPRSLHMALSKLRDVSVIKTPPPGRLPITTIVTEHNWELVAKAFAKEIERGGQGYYVFNRIMPLSSIAYRIGDLVKRIRVGYAHGQMDEKELEMVMSQFYDHKIDVLVCTTIIGSGIDMPNANTIVVDNAQRFGLAELHQLRGRVGRAERDAYAYFFYPHGYTPVGSAFERLSTINEESGLGSGFNIASRDLEIRGAGNLLGTDQHGFINLVGFELYLRLLNQAIDSLQSGKKIRKI